MMNLKIKNSSISSQNKIKKFGDDSNIMHLFVIINLKACSLYIYME